MHFQSERKATWNATDDIIDRWLEDRQLLLVSFHQVCQLKDNIGTEHFNDCLKDFCEKLIDYVSAGQFEVFEKIFEASQVDKSPSFDKEIFVKLLRTTLYSLEFNDKYIEKKDTSDIGPALSLMGEEFAKRLELEDHIIDLYVQALKELGTIT